MIISSGDLLEFLKRIKKGLGNFEEVIVPHRSKNDDSYYFGRLDEHADVFELNAYRTVTPLKYLMYPPREQVYPIEQKFPKRLIVGLKACDIKALEVFDDALLKGNFVEPGYSKWRENTYLISSDCDDIASSCHCNLTGGKPFTSNGSDVNISLIDNNYLITAFTEKGNELLGLMKMEIDFTEETEEDISYFQTNIQTVIDKLEVQNNIRGYNYNGLRNVNENEWDSVSAECIGCGACTNICPTCYCLILNDESEAEKFIKVRSYDSCQWNGYATVAGGATPRPKMYQRFRNRYLCKFDYMQNNFGKIGCSGCGRCIDACAAGIDFRDVIKTIHEKTTEQLTN